MIEVVNREEVVTIGLERYDALRDSKKELETVVRYIKGHDYLDKNEFMLLLGIDKEVECETMKARKK